VSPITLDAEIKDEVGKKIQAYLLRELDIEIGNFDAQFFLDFLAEQVGYVYYNRGLSDSLSAVEGKMEEFSDLIYQLEKDGPD